MSEMNPYEAPASRVADVTAPAGSAFVAGGRAVDAGQGWQWIAAGFALFMKQPGVWILLLIVLLACWVLIHLIPVVGALAGMLLYPVFGAGVMIGCRALDDGGALEVGHLFAGFRQNTGNLVVLGVFALIAMVIILVPAVLIAGGGSFLAMMRGDAAALVGLGMTFSLAILVVMALSVPVSMALWFAPALVVFNNLMPGVAMKASFSACMKNVVPFLVYGVILLVLGLFASIPFFLGWLILAPVTMASIYKSYRDIFFAG